MTTYIKKIIDRYNNKSIEDCGGVVSAEFKNFASYVKRQFKAAAVEYGFELDSFYKGHYDISGFFKKGTQYIYFSFNVPRAGYPMDLLSSNFMNGWLYRTAKHNKDYTGGDNNYSNLYYLMDNIKTLFERSAPKETKETSVVERCRDCAALVDIDGRACCDEYHNPKPVEQVVSCPEGLDTNESPNSKLNTPTNNATVENTDTVEDNNNTTDGKHVIWSSEINTDDWQDFLEEEYPDVDDKYEKYRHCADRNLLFLDDERKNLNIELPNSIIAIGDLGLWNGRHSGYKEYSTQLSSILYFEGDECEWYVDNNNELRATISHHDGTNYVLYRMWKGGLSEVEKDEFKDIILKGAPSISEINKYTLPVGKYVADVYGWA